MIVFDLQCLDEGHVFEAWFGSTRDFEAQIARDLVVCPICESPRVEKAAMAPRLNAGDKPKLDTGEKLGFSAGAPTSARMKALLAKLARAQSRMLAKSEHVGPRFADEARAIHVGEAEERPIHGEATLRDARSLIDDGIEVAPLPLPVRDPKSDN